MAIVSKEVTIINKLGLHARAATKLAQLSQQFSATVTVELGGNSADANSIMALMLLAGGQGKTVKVVADGDDAAEALESICQLINQRFDEAE
ncbi:HPr family phosphocarrier protein [Thalassotalea euphylliae]|uniref:HPr family phosphocarrier protein n=1 Tax=Thalassotalea euphylliae TaxID=1655234 RepID=UPI003633CF4E